MGLDMSSAFNTINGKELKKVLKGTLAQPAFTCLNLPIKTLKQGVNMFKINNKDTRTTPMAII